MVNEQQWREAVEKLSQLSGMAETLLEEIESTLIWLEEVAPQPWQKRLEEDLEQSLASGEPQ